MGQCWIFGLFNFFFVAFFLLYIIIIIFLCHPFFKSALILLYFFLIVLLSSIHFPSNGQDCSSSPTRLIRPTYQIDPKEITGSNGSFRRESNVATKHALLQHSFPSKEKPYNTYIPPPSLSLSFNQHYISSLQNLSLFISHCDTNGAFIFINPIKIQETPLPLFKTLLLTSPIELQNSRKIAYTAPSQPFVQPRRALFVNEAEKLSKPFAPTPPLEGRSNPSPPP